MWHISNATSLTFTIGSTSYAHTIKTLNVKALSPEPTAFFGTGVYKADSSCTWTMRGVVRYHTLFFSIRSSPSATPAPMRVTGSTATA